jgi:hypothetical protein
VRIAAGAKAETFERRLRPERRNQRVLAMLFTKPSGNSSNQIAMAPMLVLERVTRERATLPAKFIASCARGSHTEREPAILIIVTARDRSLGWQ